MYVMLYSPVEFDSKRYWRRVWHWGILGFWLCPPSGILRNTTFRTLDLFPLPGKCLGDTFFCWIS
jgi:hypothetical protein